MQNDRKGSSDNIGERSSLSEGSGSVAKVEETPEVPAEIETEESKDSEPKLYSRRNIIFAILTGTISGIISNVGVWKAMDGLAERSTETKARERVLDLFFQGIDQFDLILAANHPTTPPNYRGTYVNEWEAKMAIRDL